MSSTTHDTAPTTFAKAAGSEYAYRRFGTPAGTPLLMLQAFRGNLDSWDPALTDALAAGREVILVDYPGVSSSAGTPARTVPGTAQQIIAFAGAIGLDQADLLGFSLGGFVAQDIALTRPDLVRRLILAGTGPRWAAGLQPWPQDVASRILAPQPGAEDLLYLFFARTGTSQAKGAEFLGRFLRRSDDRDPASDLAARDAQHQAIRDWDTPDHDALQRLAGIRCPALILHGDNNRVIPARASHLTAGLIPDARITIYPDSAHAFLFQYPGEVAAQISTFLS